MQRMRSFKLWLAPILVSVSLSTFASLFDICIGTSNPEVGAIYDNGIMPLSILQVLHGAGGVLVHQKDRDLHLSTKIIFVKMNVDGLTDDSRLPNGLYKCTGTYVYETIGGNAKTIPAFCALSATEVDEYRKEKQRVEEENKREQEKRNAELEKQAEVEQPEREKFAKEVLSSVELDVAKYFRIDPRLAGKFKIFIKHFSWREMESQKRKSAWLDLLNSMCDVLEQKDDFTHRYKQFPSKEIITAIVGNFKTKCPLPITIELTNVDETKSRGHLPYCAYVKNKLWGKGSAEKITKLRKINHKCPFVDYPLLSCSNWRHHNDERSKIRFGQTYYLVFAEDFSVHGGPRSRGNTRHGMSRTVYSTQDGQKIEWPENRTVWEFEEQSANDEYVEHSFPVRSLSLLKGRKSKMDEDYLRYIEIYEKYINDEISASEYLEKACSITENSEFESEIAELFVGLNEAPVYQGVLKISRETSGTIREDVKEFAALYTQIKPSARSKTELSKKLSVLVQAMRNEKMAAVYKRYTKGDARVLLTSFESDWKNASKEGREKIYLKYQQAYIGHLQEIAAAAGSSDLNDFVARGSSNDFDATSGKRETFTSQSEQQIKMTCDDCAGKGSVVCSECEGAGKVRPVYKAGLGGRNMSMRKATCPACKGKGRVKCGSCKGKGRISGNKDSDSFR